MARISAHPRARVEGDATARGLLALINSGGAQGIIMPPIQIERPEGAPASNAFGYLRW